MRHSLSHSWLFMIGALPIVMLCAPENRAAASCGDYVHIVSKSASSTDPHTPAAPQSPCNGPGCQQQKAPAMPMPTPVPPSTQNQLPDAILIASVEFEPATSSFPVDPEVYALARGHLDTIFHPPR